VDFIAMDVNYDFMRFQFQCSLVSCRTTQWDSEYETGECLQNCEERLLASDLCSSGLSCSK